MQRVEISVIMVDEHSRARMAFDTSCPGVTQRLGSLSMHFPSFHFCFFSFSIEDFLG